MLTLPACGIVFSAGFEGTEVFRDLELDGEFRAGSAVTATVTVTQPYAAPLAVSCRYENRDITDDQRKVAFSERALPVFDAVLEAHTGPRPDDRENLAVETMSFEFTVSEPGDYFIACFTVAAPENGIGQRFTVEAP